MWLLVDVEKKRLQRIPPELGAAYTTEDDSAGEMDIDGWEPERNRITDFTVDMTTRYCDLDPVGHLNNTIYFDFVETLAARAFDGNIDIRSLKMQFQKEIKLDNRWVSAGFRKTDSGGLFSIFSGETVFASGEITY
jgi:acyl-ACP thioesterase